MKKGILLILVCCQLTPFFLLSQTNAFQVMTFNIRYPNPDDGFNYWPNRKDLVVSMIKYHEADIVGVQEALRSQLDDLSKALSDMAWTGLCRTDGSTTPQPDNEFSAIFYRKDRFDLLESQTFWLSENPAAVGIAGWDGALPRIVTWALFRDKHTLKTFYHFNTHFDHIGKIARRESARLLLSKVKEIAGATPTVVTGDFNAIPTDEPMVVLTNSDNPDHLQDALSLSQLPHHGPLGTWTNAFQFPGMPGQRIDYILVRKGISVLKHAILSDSWSGRLPSDHLPVLARLVLP